MSQVNLGGSVAIPPLRPAKQRREQTSVSSDGLGGGEIVKSENFGLHPHLRMVISSLLSLSIHFRQINRLPIDSNLSFIPLTPTKLVR
jgi:hypothetical protein